MTLLPGYPRLAGLVFLALPAAAPAVANGDRLSGVPYVIDADTLVVDGCPVDLEGIDALEIDQVCSRTGVPWPCGRDASNALARFIGARPVSCEITGQVGPQVWLGRCRVAGLDLGAEMVSQGYALPWPEFSERYRYPHREARQREAGMWGGTYVRPVDWRAGRRLGVPGTGTTPSPP